MKKNPNSIISTENIAALNSSATELLVFSHEGVRDWEVVNVTAKTGKTIIGEAISWISQDGFMSVEYIAGNSPDGSLLVFWRFANQDWQAVNMSVIAGGGSITSSRPVGWTDNQLFNDYVAVCGQNLKLLVYMKPQGPGTNWVLVDVTAITGIKITEVFTVYQLVDSGNVTVLIARGIDGSFLQFWKH